MHVPRVIFNIEAKHSLIKILNFSEDKNRQNEIDAEYDPNLIHLPRNMKLINRKNDDDEEDEDWEMEKKLKSFKRREQNHEDDQKRQALHDQILKNLKQIDEGLLSKFEEQPIRSIVHIKMLGLPMSISGDFIGNSLGEQEKKEIKQMNEHLLWQRMQNLLVEGEYTQGNVLDEGTEQRPLLGESPLDKNNELPAIQQGEEEKKEEIEEFWQNIDEEKEKKGLEQEEAQLQEVMDEAQRLKKEEEEAYKHIEEEQKIQEKEKKKKGPKTTVDVTGELLGEDGTKLLGSVIDLNTKFGKFKTKQWAKSVINKLGKLAVRTPTNQVSVGQMIEDPPNKIQKDQESQNFWANKRITVSQIVGEQIQVSQVRVRDLPDKFERSIFGMNEPQEIIKQDDIEQLK